MHSHDARHHVESSVDLTQGVALRQAGKPDRHSPMLRDRLSRLSEAILRLNQELDLDTILQEVLEGARSLTGARYGAILVFDSSGGMRDFITSGISPEERKLMQTSPRGLGLLGYLNEVQGSVRLSDIASHPSSVGFPENHPPMKTFLATPVRHRGEPLGNIYLTEKEGGREFNLVDEETLVLFASQAAVAMVTARRYRDEQRARADLEALVNISPVGVLVFDAKTGDLVSLNQESRRIVGGRRAPGRSQAELLSMMTFRRPDGREMTLQELPTERAVRSGETVRAEEIIMELPDGQAVTTVVNAAPIFSEEGEVVSVVATVQDMTPLEEMERLRAEFLGMVSHELRTPLTTIKGSTATVLGASSAFDPSEIRQFFRIIDQQADRMRDLINNLLDVTRIEAGTLSVTPEPTDVADAIDQAMEAFLLGGARNRIEVDIPNDLPRIAADRQRIAQVLGNLLSNASEHSPESSTIKVTVSQDGFHVLFAVSDEGRGVSPERLPHLFKKFSRGEGEEALPSIDGTGLGLAICKGIVEAHGGRIWARSDGPGLGARFAFTIPVVEEVVNVSANTAHRLSAGSGQTAPEGTRILVVDDDPQILRYVKSTLSDAGYTPIVTGDPRDVERVIEVEKPRLFLLDLMLPGTDGFELMRRISAITDAPVIFLSARSEDHIIERAFETGAADYVVKPFSPTELLARRGRPCAGEPFPLRAGRWNPLSWGT